MAVRKGGKEMNRMVNWDSGDLNQLVIKALTSSLVTRNILVTALPKPYWVFWATKLQKFLTIFTAVMFLITILERRYRFPSSKDFLSTARVPIFRVPSDQLVYVLTHPCVKYPHLLLDWTLACPATSTKMDALVAISNNLLLGMIFFVTTSDVFLVGMLRGLLPREVN